jgi:hypothetical protein
MNNSVEKILVLPKTEYRYSLRPAFALNRVLREIRIMAEKELGKFEDTYIVPYLFNKRSRTFLTFGFTDKALDSDDEAKPKEILEGIRTQVNKASIVEWKRFLRHVSTSNQENQKRIEECIAQDGGIYNLDDNNFVKVLKDFSYPQWMDIYIHYKQHRNMHLNGIFFRLLHGEFPTPANNKNNQFDAVAFNVGKSIDKPPTWGFSCSNGWESLGELLQQTSLGEDHSRGEAIHFELTALFALPGKEDPRWVLLIPVYDNYIAGQPYGGICATLQLPVNSELDLTNNPEAVSVAVKKLISCAQVMSLEIAASGVERAIRDAVAPRHTAISEFISGLRYLQDWQCIRIKSTNPSENLVFKRTNTPIVSDWADSELAACDPNKELCSCCMQSDQENPVTLSWSRDAEKEKKDGAVAQEVNFSYIGGVEKNLSEFEGLEKVEFFFPKYFRLPVKDSVGNEINPFWEAYCDDLIRQQRELLSVLMPKLRARKAALRSAVSAIMGRNMSHNIGSHVLARYSSKVKGDNEAADQRNFKDHREAFLRYLQRRMDFIAEIATSDQSLWSQALSIEGALSTLNIEKERAEIDANAERKPILLSYITGKEIDGEPLTATVVMDKKLKGGAPHYFACPSGEVGVHALNIILENIIRNSARHNDQPTNPITVKVRIDEDKGNPSLWKVTLIDLQSKVKHQKDIVESINDKLINTPILKEDATPNPLYWGIREMQVCAQYLRNLPLSDLEGSQQAPLVLNATAYPEDGEEDGKKYLAYELYLRRARLCMFVFKKQSDVVQNKELTAQGFGVVSIDVKTDTELAAALRGYAYAVVDEMTCPDHVESSDQHWIRKIDWPVRTLCLPSDKLKALNENLVRSIDKKGANFDPMSWLENNLHEKLADEYRIRRSYLRDTKLAVKVGWEDTVDVTEKDFVHSSRDKLADDQDCTEKLLCWIDHAKAEHFTNLPYLHLLASAQKTEMTTNFNGTEHSSPIDCWVYAEVFNSYSPHCRELERQKNRDILGNELKAAAMAKIAVIDERVQSEASGEYRSGLSYSTLWPCMGVWVPSADQANLNAPVFDKISSFLKNPTKREEQLPIDFLVLHLTILEKLAQEIQVTEQEALECLVICAGLKPNCEVVIVTGRGVPAVARHEVSKRLNARYLPISAILEYLVSNPSKLAVMRSLWSASTSKTTE